MSDGPAVWRIFFLLFIDFYSHWEIRKEINNKITPARHRKREGIINSVKRFLSTFIFRQNERVNECTHENQKIIILIYIYNDFRNMYEKETEREREKKKGQGVKQQILIKEFLWWREKELL
jgi:hypothetical protein